MSMFVSQLFVATLQRYSSEQNLKSKKRKLVRGRKYYEIH